MDLHGFGADDLVCYCVGSYSLTVAPTGVPLLQIDGIGTDVDKNAVVEIEAVAANLVCNVVLGGVGGGLHGLTGCQEHCAQ